MIDLYYKLNKNKIKAKREELHKQFPWKRVLQHIKQRCNNPKAKDYKWYGLRGIKCLITEEELKFLWFRDKAYNMTKPTIDREDNDGHYEYKNCQFIELVDNLKKQDRSKFSIKVLQFDLQGKFIKEWKSMREIERILHIGHKEVSYCCSNKYKTAGGYIWKYKNEH